MLVIRLTRVGKKNQASFRLVLTDRRWGVNSGKFKEILGSYSPRLKTKVLKGERIKYWLSKGAQASPTVHNLLVSEKIIEAKKVKAWRPKKKTQDAKAKATAEAAKAEAAPKGEEVEEAVAAEPEPAPAEEVKKEAAPVEKEKKEEVAPEEVKAEESKTE